MKKSDLKLIVIGIGNAGRQDDALGWVFLDALEKNSPEIFLEYRYQLQIEDADLISEYDVAVFVDATKEQTPDGFYLKACLPVECYDFSTHALRPETVVYLKNTLYKKSTRAFVLGIEGYEWDLGIGLSQQAQLNLEQAIYFFNRWLQLSVNGDKSNAD